MTDQRISAALAKLDHGTWSLTAAGFARRALKMAEPMSGADRARARDAMMATGLPHRRVPGPTGHIDVWDYDAR